MNLGDLTNYDRSVDPLTLVGDLSAILKKEPGLPGILIISKEKGFLGMISRDHYFETMGKPYGIELHSKHTVLHFCRHLESTPLIMDVETRVEDVVKVALGRKESDLYEPVVVHDADNTYKLVNMQTLLLAQVDLTEKLYKEVQQLSIRDPLTNLRNRRGFFEEAIPQVQRALEKEEDISALMIDIDHFKYINDIYGHFAGDQVLKSMTEEIQKALRQTDLLGRFGGEEFIAILPETGLKTAEIVAERVRSKIEALQIYLDGYQISITVSIGVSHMQKAGGSLDKLLLQADQAMYAAKQDGRNQVLTYKNIHNQQIRKGAENLPDQNPETQKKLLDVARLCNESVDGWILVLEKREKGSKEHTHRVTHLAIELAKRFGINHKDLVNFRIGAMLHDIGKIIIPDQILLKSGKLNAEDWTIMKKHPIYGFELLSTISYLREMVEIPYCHHEHWDGSGYPRGIKQDEIPLAARIFTIVDVWDALSSDRPYRKAWKQKRIRKYFQDEAGKLFDPSVVEPFFKVLSEFNFHSPVDSISTANDRVEEIESDD